MKVIRTLIAAAAFSLTASAFAAPTTVLPGPEAPSNSLQTLLNGLFPVAGTAPDVNNDQAAESGLFQIDGSGGTVSRILFEIAGNKNTNSFGIYDPFGNQFLQIYSGLDSANKFGVVSVNGFMFTNELSSEARTFTSDLFGYYLDDYSDKVKGPVRYFSQASRNAGGEDQFIAFQGEGQPFLPPYLNNPAEFGSQSYIFAFEDQPYSRSDKDFNDFVVYAESVSAVPEPGSLALLGLGLAGLAAASRRKQKQA